LEVRKESHLQPGYAVREDLWSYLMVMIVIFELTWYELQCRYASSLVFVLMSVDLLEQGTPKRAHDMPVIVLFSPLLLVQGVAVGCALLRLLEQLWVMLRPSEASGSQQLAFLAKAEDCCGFLHHGSKYFLVLM
jgi:hypothetical protein